MKDAPVDVTKLDSIKDEKKFDEQEAYFELCQIIAYAQATHDYDRLIKDLEQWKSRYDVELFSDELKYKVKYMLSLEFLSKVLKDFQVFYARSQLVPEHELQKFYNLLNKADKTKNRSEFEKELSKMDIDYLKSHYPHIVSMRLGKTYLDKLFEKFDEARALSDLTDITTHYDRCKNADDFKDKINEWNKSFPTNDFNASNKSKVENILKEYTNENRLLELFPAEINLAEGVQVDIINSENQIEDLPEDISIISRDAMLAFRNIVDKNIHDTDGLFNWLCTYKKYINSFENSIKEDLVNSLMPSYKGELSTETDNYYIPKMNNDYLLSLSDYNSIDDIKKNSVLQFLGLLSTDQSLTHEDAYRLDIINKNAHKVNEIKEANIDEQVQEFVKEIPEEQLTPLEIKTDEDLTADISNDDVTITLTNTLENSPEGQEEKAEDVSFKEALKVDDIQGVELERVENSNNSSNSNNTSGGSSSGGGTSVSISHDDEESNTTNDIEDEMDDDESSNENEEPPIEETTRQNIIQRFISIFQRAKENDFEDNELNNSPKNNALDESKNFDNDIPLNNFDDSNEKERDDI